MLRQVKTENGIVRGIPAADPRITAFKGIPFAAPPVGKNRWRAPQPAENWEGVRNCFEFAPIAMQEIPGADPNAFYSKEWHVDPTVPMSEDCLYLNLWTPARTGEEKLPVMVWFFGGGLTVGYPSEMEFDGERIARRGVILVSVNYRLNAFGFLCHPEITAENPDYPANFGHLDQRAGIEWVRRNINAFGGDPDNITVFGQSAGGGSTFAQVCSPLNKGLFKRAVCHSSGGLLPPSLGSDSLSAAEETGKKFFSALGVNTLEEARGIDAKIIRDLAFSTRAWKWGTVIGDQFMPKKPTEFVIDDDRNNVQIMLGNTEDEFPSRIYADTVEEFETEARHLFGEDAEEYIRICKKNGNDLQGMIQAGTIQRFKIGNMLWTDEDIRHGSRSGKMYFYNFNPEMPGDNAGSFHSSDLWFTFETLSKCWRPFTGKHYDLARQMCNYWTNFAKYGDPNGLDADGTPMPTWRPVSEGDVHPMYFGDTAFMDEKPRNEMEEFLTRYYTKKLTAHEMFELPAFRRVSSDKNSNKGELLR